MRMEVGNGDEFNLGEVLKVCGTAGTIPPHFWPLGKYKENAV